MATRKRAKMGRPPVPDAKRLDQVFTLRMTAAERRRLEAAARGAGTTVAGVLMAPWRREGGR